MASKFWVKKKQLLCTWFCSVLAQGLRSWVCQSDEASWRTCTGFKLKNKTKLKHKYYIKKRHKILVENLLLRPLVFNSSLEIALSPFSPAFKTGGDCRRSAPGQLLSRGSRRSSRSGRARELDSSTSARGFPSFVRLPRPKLREGEGRRRRRRRRRRQVSGVRGNTSGRGGTSREALRRKCSHAGESSEPR